MCGIVGYSGAKIDGLVPRMLNQIRHRGPDDDGEYSDERVQLGMVRLSIIDLSGGHQPMANDDGSVQVIFNGEIFNYIELRAELEAKGYHFKTSSDTETIIHAYEEYGVSFAHKLNGMFAIALWDRRDKREPKLLVYRDRFGVKPLFYSNAGGGLIFGSEIKTILCHPAVSRELDSGALSHYLSLRNIPAPFTIYRDVRALLPGQMFTWSAPDGIKLSKWYQLPTAPQWNDQDENVLVDRIDELLRDAVRIRLRSDVNYGAYLSGGIDSSTVVAITSEFSPAPVKTFTLGFADSPAHKRDAFYARQVAEQYGTEHHECVMSSADLQNELPAVIRHLDQPFAGVISSFWLSRFMKQFVTVALSGDGADDMFGSYGHHRLVWPLAALRRAAEENGSAPSVDLSFFKGKEDFVRSLSGLPPWEWRLAYGAFMEHERAALLTQSGHELMNGNGTACFLKKIYEQCDPRADELNKILYLDISTLLPNEILYFNDMLSMAHSMEVRTPFLDFRVAELAASIPGTLKIRDGQLKYILRRVAARYVSREILERPKEGFVLPKNTWLRAGMSGLLDNVLSPERLAIHGYFKHEEVASLIARFVAGDDALTFKIWTLMIFQIWYEEHLGSGQ
ncbi:MAG TPA: asparagine synthase (glutamine-hydrolyzing) [Pyrinomonadaceae bacterium]|nr:asparagine synthase (glutamine-hydrolyzing) [Pyrinomonadaceae bacterium]